MNSKIAIVIVILLIILAGGFLVINKPKSSTSATLPSPSTTSLSPTSTNPPIPTNENPTKTINSSSKKTYSLDEIKQHNSASDCWMLINNKVYDVTIFITQHPGGRVILQGCGIDASNLFNSIPKHKGVQQILSNFEIGVLK